MREHLEPVERVLEPAGYRPVVQGAAEDERVGRVNRIGEDARRLGRFARRLGREERQLERRHREGLDARPGRCRALERDT